MKYGIYIQADHKQQLGAKVAKYAIETRGGARARGIPVSIMQVEDHPQYMSYTGMEYRRGDERRVHDPTDLQFFTLSRFMPPGLMGYEGRALVIDPDIFALQDITSLFDLDFEGASLAACRERTWYDSSMMLLDCAKLKHWDISKLLEGLKNGTENYRTWMRLLKEPVHELPRMWNSIDLLTPETKMLHTSKRLTQPWKTGLPIDFIPGTVPKLWGVVPRFWVQHPTHYQPHPEKKTEELFFALVKDALAAGAITEAEIRDGILSSDLRPDFMDCLAGPSVPSPAA